jgi:CheY-like chemotaxis protein
MSIKILWADDEIDLLKPHIIFLQSKSYSIDAVNSGADAIEHARNYEYDAIFLDEQMPGINGLEALQAIKVIRPGTPVVMITKSEEENIMEAAIGSQIADYLIKPVNPNQILLSLKKILDKSALVAQKTADDYRTAFQTIASEIGGSCSWDNWAEVYSKLSRWSIELSETKQPEMAEILQMQYTEANSGYARYIKDSYMGWFSNAADKPLLTTGIIRHKVAPLLAAGKKTMLLVIDNLRLDQWWAIRSDIKEHYKIANEELCSAILPTTTQYSRNSLFAGLMPSEIARKYPHLWKDDAEEGGKNMHEEELLAENLKGLGYADKFYFEKVVSSGKSKKIQDMFASIKRNQFSALVYNFVDTLSHARTEMEIIKELARDENAYRSLTKSWFGHSPLSELLSLVSKLNITIVIATDHGSVRGINPIKITGEKDITTNLRYKSGRTLSYNIKDVYEIKEPERAGLPSSHLSSSYVFATKSDFFAYPNNFNHYAKYYRDTFQHGGVSLEEMIIPLAVLEPK